MINHTPWKQAEDGFSIYIQDSQGDIIADVRASGLTLGLCTSQAMDEHRKRAKLMAAAPEMFNAIREFRELFTDKKAGIQFAANTWAMIKMQAIFADMEMAYRKAEGAHEKN
jgi:hypothetical protein